MNEVLTDAELAGEWKVRPQLVQKMLRNGQLRGFKCGDLWRITREAVVEYESGRPAKPAKSVRRVS